MHNPTFDYRETPVEDSLLVRTYSKNSSKSDPRGISFAQGPSWHSLRRFSLRALRDMGLGKDISETIILDEISYFVEHLT